MLLLVTFSCLLLRPCSSSAAEGGNVTASQRALSVFSVVKVRRARGSVLRAHVRIVSSSPTLPAPPPRPGETAPATPARSAPPTGRGGVAYGRDIYTAHCSGTASGSCASSFGVCCIFEKTCDGGSVSQNLTYFTSSSRAVGAACELTICKCATDVCQLRLDFETFVLSDPVTATTITVGPATAAAGTANSIGQCNVDTFSVTVPGGKSQYLHFYQDYLDIKVI